MSTKVGFIFFQLISGNKNHISRSPIVQSPNQSISKIYNRISKLISYIQGWRNHWQSQCTTQLLNFFLFNFIFFSHYSLLTSFQVKPPHPLDEKSNMESSPSCGVIFIGLNSPSPTVFSKQESLPLSRFTSQDLSVSLSGISKILALHLRFLFSFKSWMRTLISPNLSFFKP